MLNLTIGRHLSYCEKHKMSYASRNRTLDGYFDKPYFIKDFLGDFDLIVWMDADSFIARNVNLLEVPIKKDQIGVCYYKTPTHHFNTGVVYVKPGKRVNLFVDEWLAGYPCEHEWKDQKVFNDIANECVVVVPDEWNSCHINRVDNPIIKSFHGKYSCFDEKYETMKREFEYEMF